MRSICHNLALKNYFGTNASLVGQANFLRAVLFSVFASWQTAYLIFICNHMNANSNNEGFTQ